MTFIKQQSASQPKSSLKDRTMRNVLLLAATAIISVLLLAGINYVSAIVRGWRISNSPWF